MKRIYFDIDRLGLLLAWLEQRPTDCCQILIGSDGDTDVTRRVMALVTRDAELARWLLLQLKMERLTLRVSPRIEGVPEGMEF